MFIKVVIRDCCLGVMSVIEESTYPTETQRFYNSPEAGKAV